MKFVDPHFKGVNSGHYVPGVISNGMVYVSGQLSLDPDTREVCKGDIRAHARQALENVDRVLKAAGSDRSKVVQCRVYTTKGGILGSGERGVRRVFRRPSPGPDRGDGAGASLRVPR